MNFSYFYFIPELQYWIQKIFLKYSLNENAPPRHMIINQEDCSPNTFIELLLNDDWPSDSTNYNYNYELITNKGNWPVYILRKLSIYSKNTYYCTISDTTNSGNLFELEADDFTMLDVLLKYRLNIQDSTQDFEGIMFTNLTTNISKLIFLYLDFKINNNLSYYDNIITNTDSNALEKIFELYLIMSIFEYYSNIIVTGFD